MWTYIHDNITGHCFGSASPFADDAMRWDWIKSTAASYFECKADQVHRGGDTLTIDGRVVAYLSDG